jgi:hypothetical protein
MEIGRMRGIHWKINGFRCAGSNEWEEIGFG